MALNPFISCLKDILLMFEMSVSINKKFIKNILPLSLQNYHKYLLTGFVQSINSSNVIGVREPLKKDSASSWVAVKIYFVISSNIFSLKSIS